MDYNGVVFYGKTLMDLSGDTVTPEALKEGFTAHDASGKPIVGTFDGLDTSDATAEAGDILSPKTAYTKDGKAAGTIPTKAEPDVGVSGRNVTIPAGYYKNQVVKSVDSAQQAAPEIFVAADGTVTATAAQSAGYVAAGTKTATHKLSASDDADFVAANIRRGANIFGITGTLDEGIDTSGATATESDMLDGKTAYVKGAKIAGNIPSKSASDLTANGSTVAVPAGYYAEDQSKSVPTATHPKPAVSIDGNTGVVTASHTQTEGYVSTGTTSETLNLTTQDAKTVTPGTSEQTAVAAGRYTIGAVNVAGDANLAAENIKSGVSIFGVTGAYGFDTYDGSVEEVS